MGREGVWTFTRPLRYRTTKLKLPDGTFFEFRTGEEKGIDIRIAVDIIRLALRNSYDVGLVFSQDQDRSEVAQEIRSIIAEQDRWIKLASAYPVGPGTRNRRGIDKTDWIELDRAFYDACIDPRDYRP